MPFIRSILVILVAIGAVEGVAWWWMHPAPAGLGDPVLAYRPERAKDIDPPFSIGNPRSEIASTFTHLPEIATRAIPTLRCSTGTVARIDRDDGVTIHIAFFEWDLSDSTNVLEAFKHLPDECMGSIGIKLTAKHPPRSYQVGNETLWFDHTTFHDPAGVVIHAYKGTWVSGATDLLGPGARGGGDQWRQIRWKSALNRFHPAYARVAQGAVRGIPNPDFAWQIFEDALLQDLVMEKQ